MDHKTWRWKKRSSEKTIVANDKADDKIKRTEEKVRTILSEKEIEGHGSFKDLSDKFDSILTDCQAKDELILKHEKATEEAIADKDRAEARAILLQQELEQALRQGAAANERLTHLDTELKECTEQLHALREEAELATHDAIAKASREFIKAQKKSDEKLTNANKKLASLSLENTCLNAEISAKEKQIEDLYRRKSLAESESDALMARLDCTEKENAFLKYEFCLLEKELVIRNEELEYSQRSAEVSKKKHQQSLKKITKLEGECQRLRLLTQKRLPGPVALARMKGELKMLGSDQTEGRKIKPGLTTDLIVRGKNSHEIPSNRIHYLIEQLHDVEEENKTLKEIISIKDAELHSSRISHAGTTSRLLQVEAQVADLSKGQCKDLVTCEPLLNDLSLVSDLEDSASSGSWANALISELEHFRNGKVKNALESKHTSLMSDFSEMEKLAMVSVESPSGSESLSCSTCKEIVRGDPSLGDTNKMIQSENTETPMSFDWLQVVLNAIMEQKRVSKRGMIEILEDIRIALGLLNSGAPEEAQATTSPMCTGESDSPPISGYLTWKSPIASPIIGSLGKATTRDEMGGKMQSKLTNSIEKIVRLVKKFNPMSTLTSEDLGKSQIPSSLNWPAPKDCVIHVFQWKSTELRVVLQKFIHTCNDLLDHKAGVETFAEELACTLHWILDKHSTPKHASSVRHKIKMHSGWTESPLNSKELEVYEDILPLASKSTDVAKRQSLCSGNLQEENRTLKHELQNMETAKEDVETKLQLANNEIKVLTTQLRQANESIRSLNLELENLKEAKRIVEDQMENQKSMNEDLDTQLTVAKAKLNEVFQKFSSLEVELEDKNNSCEELESMCLELQLQLESVAKETPKDGTNQDQMLSQSGWEITAASVKLAECRETILNLSRQLKALGPPQEPTFSNKGLPGSDATNTFKNKKSLNKRLSLRDRMLAEDDPEAAKDIEIASEANAAKLNALVVANVPAQTPEAYLGLHNRSGNSFMGALTVVPSKRQGGISFLRRLLLRRKRRSRTRSQSLSKI
ncbi:filament-like plant protein 7 isoform X2 [Syzygium oleosum]|nr:filament-like plant protein 7 isoform X2 [Syzygium oleosum]XP_030475936.2 filament-like plant protein 7 isoform X2 [Syzygium oleosum]XP_056163778.1 filament-like plant protein 7 isoform X2 [Syzygium oleosum]